MSVDFEPIDVTQDLDLSEVVRTNIEGTSVVDYDVEYGVLPVNPEQLVAPTHNVGVPAEGTLGPYQTDGEGESDIWKVIGATVKAGGEGYAKDATAKIPGKYPSDVPAVIKIDSVTEKYYEIPSISLENGGYGFAVNETITIAQGSAGDTPAVATVTGVKNVNRYSIYELSLDAQIGESVTSFVLLIKGPSEGDSQAIIVYSCSGGEITNYTVSNAGDFATDPETWTTFDYEVADITGGGDVVIERIYDVRREDPVYVISGVIDTISLTNKGHFASSIDASTQENLSGSISGRDASISNEKTIERGSAISSVSIVSEGSYARELDGDVDVVAGSGTGGKITVDMEMEEPESGEESGSEE